MKKGFDGEKIAILIFVIIIIAVIFYVAFSIFTNNNNLNSNENSQNKMSQNNNTTTDISEEEKDKMNIDKEKIPNTSSEQTPTQKEEYEQIATYTTTIYDKDQNRVDNITLANSKLNNYIIKKGEEFSYNNTIGPMDESHGFKKALGFDTDGNKIKISGGGLCQISSTLYNAVLMANLEVIERHPHSRRVYYVPKDKDATIVYGSLDFKFKNNTDSDIIINATNDNANVTITLKKIKNGSI